MEMKFIVVSLKDFSFNLRGKVLDRLLLPMNADNKYKWPPPIAGELFD